MQRVLVILLAAVDAVVAVAVGVAVALAPLTLLWVFGIGDPQWGALWPAAGSVWQLGHLVPLAFTLPGDYLAATGIDVAVASFTLSLAPLAFAAFTAIFAARSGARAARAGAWLTGVLSGSVMVAALAAAIAMTARNAVAEVQLWQAVLYPALIFALPAMAGALATAWREGDGGLVDRVHNRVEAWPGEWAAVPGHIARGSAIALTGLVGIAALAVTVALAGGGGDIIALFETGNVDALGATVITLGQLAYLPTLVVWALAYIAGPGFALGVGTTVSPAGTQLGVVPAVPLFGAIPEFASPWLLTLIVVPIVIGGIAGCAARARVADRKDESDAAAAVPVHPALVGLIPERASEAAAEPKTRASRPFGALATIAAGIALATAGGAALLSWLAAGSIGPDRLAVTGPAVGPVALAIGLETLVGAAIALLTTRRRRRRDIATAEAHIDTSAPEVAASEEWAVAAPAFAAHHGQASGDLLDDLRARVVEHPPSSEAPAIRDAPPEPAQQDADAVDTAPVELPDPSTLGRHRPTPLPPVD